MEYFQCQKGCGKCCPNGSLPLVPLTLADIVNLYRMEVLPPTDFVGSHVRWNLYDRNFEGNLWMPILPPSCPYLSDRECTIYNQDERPLVCKTFPEIFLVPPEAEVVPSYLKECLTGKSLTPERITEIRRLEAELSTGVA